MSEVSGQKTENKQKTPNPESFREQAAQRPTRNKVVRRRIKEEADI